jgi:hypothetical protein
MRTIFITNYGKRLYLGRFVSKEFANEVYQQYAKTHHVDFYCNE